MKKLLFTGYALVISALIILLPLLLIFFYPREFFEIKYFLTPALIYLTLGIYLIKTNEIKEITLNKKQTMLVIICLWLLLIFLLSIPFMLKPEYNFTQAIFETTSGFSTTGLSIVNVEKATHVLLMYRSILLLIGGVGVVVIFMFAFSKVFDDGFFIQEGHEDIIIPKLKSTAKIICQMYLGYILLGTILYKIFGMNLFDAINHAIAAVSTGGFSTHKESIGYFNSIPIEIITICLMILGSINFFLQYYIITNRDIKALFKDSETKLGLCIIYFSVILMTVVLCVEYNQPISDTIRTSLFQIVSALTTTGFQTLETFNHIPAAPFLILIIVMMIGGGLGSTSGGIKLYRIVIFVKSIWKKLTLQTTNENKYIPQSINRGNKKIKITDDIIISSLYFIFIYLIVLIIGTFILSLYGYPIGDCLFEMSSALSGVGLSTGICNPHAPPLVLWVLIVGMFLGRLEIIIVIIIIIRTLKNIKRRIKGKCLR